MTLWPTTVLTPRGPATDEATVRIALRLCDQEEAEIRPHHPTEGEWLIGFSPELTKDWTPESTGGGMIFPAMDTSNRLWLLDVRIR